MTDDPGGVTPFRRPGGPGGDYIELLGRATLFAGLSPHSLGAIAARLTERNYARGEVVWRAGDEGGELLVVASGQLEVWGMAAGGQEELVGTIGRGECAGEMALVLDERRSATVICGRATRALVLGKDDFRQAVREDTQVMASLTRLLSQRAMALARHHPVTSRPIVVGVVAEPDVAGASLIAAAVSELTREVLGCGALLVRVGKDGIPIGSLADGDIPAAAVRSRGDLPPVLDVSAPEAPGGHEIARAVDTVLHAYGGRFRLFVIDFPTLPHHGVELAANACEFVIQVTKEPTPAPVGAARVFQVVNRYRATGPAPWLNHCEPFVLPDDPAMTAGWERDRLGPLPLADPTQPASRVLRRLTRKVAGATVGIALGGGAAFGIAHVGVLLALEQAGLPVDLVAGTSMGSIVAIGYAAGMPPQEMQAVAGRIGNVRTVLSVLDPSLSGVGLLSGHRLVSIFSPLLDRDSFAQLDVPCQVVAMDIDSGSAVTIGTGPLDAAFRASCSIPLIFKPVQMDGHTLVDGGMIDPVPSNVVRDMGADIVIAVNVVPRLDPAVSTSLSRTFKRINRLNPLSYLSGSRGMPDVVDILMNSLQAIQFELGNYKSASADVLINIDLGDFTWIDFHRALEIVDRGLRAGEASVPDVRAALAGQLMVDP